jgi:hypothetical protein
VHYFNGLRAPKLSLKKLGNQFGVAHGPENDLRNRQARGARPPTGGPSWRGGESKPYRRVARNRRQPNAHIAAHRKTWCAPHSTAAISSGAPSFTTLTELTGPNRCMIPSMTQTTTTIPASRHDEARARARSGQNTFGHRGPIGMSIASAQMPSHQRTGEKTPTQPQGDQRNKPSASEGQMRKAPIRRTAIPKRWRE